MSKISYIRKLDIVVNHLIFNRNNIKWKMDTFFRIYLVSFCF